MDKLYTLTEAKEYLKISDSTIRRLIKNGELEASRLGRQFRIKESVLITFTNKNIYTTNEDREVRADE